jgi:hypothetical protein
MNFRNLQEYIDVLVFYKAIRRHQILVGRNISEYRLTKTDSDLKMFLSCRTC